MDEEDFSKLPLSDRAVHKQWKVRSGAYEEMKKQFSSSGSESDACFKPFLENPSIYKKIITDTNVVALEQGINSLSAFIEYGGANACLRTRSILLNPLVEKGLSSNRAGTRQASINVLLLYIEMDTPDPVIEDLLPYLSHKLPKLVSAVVAALVCVFREFGAKTVSPKPLMKSIPLLFSHADKTVRAEASNLVVELYKWLGQGISTLILPDLKPVQQKELQELFSQFDSSGEVVKQTRFIKSQKEAMERQQASGISQSTSGASSDGFDNMVDDEVDPLDLVEAVSILPKIAPNLSEQISSTKWKDRKEALEELLQVLKSAPKLQNDDFTEIVRLLAKCIQKDANIQVVTLAANCIELLANGLRQAFSRYETIILSSLLERTKEKKQSVADALGSCLDSVYKSTNLSSILETVIEFLKHKTPQVKIESSKFLIRCLKSTPTIPNPPEIKLIIDSSIKLLSDTQEPVRNCGAEILGVIMKIVGERVMNPYMDGIDDIKKGKIKEFFESAVVVAKQVVKSNAPTRAAPAAAPAAVPTPSSTTPGPRQPGLSKPSARPVQGMRSTPAKPPPAARRRLMSPIKVPSLGGTTNSSASSSIPSSIPSSHSTNISPPFDSAPTPQPKLNGLTNRVLSSRQPTKQLSTTPAIPDARLVELDQLRNERMEFVREIEQLKWKSQEDQAEKNRLMQELSDAQRKIAEHIEKQTNETLRIKSLETQLTRAHSDIETIRSRNNKLELELERVKSIAIRQEHHPQPHSSPPSQQFSSSDPNLPTGPSTVLRSLSTGRATGPPSARGASPKSSAMTLQFGLDTRSSSTSSTSSVRSHHSSNSTLRRSVDFSNLPSSVDDDYYKNPSSSFQRRLNISDKENGLSSYRHIHHRSVNDAMMSEDAEMVDAPPSPSRVRISTTPLSSTSQFSSTSTAPTSTSTSTTSAPPQAGPEGWRRAAAATSDLRARIEAMRRARAVV